VGERYTVPARNRSLIFEVDGSDKCTNFHTLISNYILFRIVVLFSCISEFFLPRLLLYSSVLRRSAVHCAGSLTAFPIHRGPSCFVCSDIKTMTSLPSQTLRSFPPHTHTHTHTPRLSSLPVALCYPCYTR
jgi:hypothetical protein